MISCRERDAVRRSHPSKTWRELIGATSRCTFILTTRAKAPPIKGRRSPPTRAARERLDDAADYILFLEDDLDFNRHLRHNLSQWPPLRDGRLTLGSIYNPALRDEAWDARSNARIVDPKTAYGSQAFVLSKDTAAHIVRRWCEVRGLQDLRMLRLAGRLGKPVYYHAPSLVQHVGLRSTWGGGFHESHDFDPEWKA